MRGRLISRRCGLLLLACAAAAAGSGKAFDWRGYQRLGTEQIRLAFADVRDEANVHDGAGGSAVNHWYRDGRFTSQWQAGGESGLVRGSWYAADDMRCVLIDSGLPDSMAGQATSEPRCGPIYRKDGLYYSQNAAGGIHGEHRLSPLVPADAQAK